GGAEGGLQAVAGRRVADARAGIDVVVAEGGADQLLHQVSFFVGAARRGDAADRILAVLGLETPELRRGVGDRLLPTHLPPGIGDLGADHRLGDAVLVGGIAPGEAALHAGMAVIRLAVLVGHHARDFRALHLGLEGAADAAIGAGGDDAVLGLALLDDGLFHQRCRRAGLHAGAAGDAFGIQEVLGLAGGDLGFEAAAVDREREGALHFLAGAHAARADDAFRGIAWEVG